MSDGELRRAWRDGRLWIWIMNTYSGVRHLCSDALRGRSLCGLYYEEDDAGARLPPRKESYCGGCTRVAKARGIAAMIPHTQQRR